MPRFARHGGCSSWTLCRCNGLSESAMGSVRWRVLEQDLALSGVRQGAASQPWGEVL